MDEKLVRSLVNAIDRAHVDAGSVLCVLAGFGNYVGHGVPDRAFLPALLAITVRKIDRAE
jgi:hypothetical protein